jgi:hypothetical protein
MVRRSRSIPLPEPASLTNSLNLNSEIEQVVLLLVLVLEKSRYLSVTLMQRNGARRFGPCFHAQSQPSQHEQDDEHEDDF